MSSAGSEFNKKVTTTKLLGPEDIYDLYGCEWILNARRSADNLDQADEQLVSFRLREIQAAYVHACTARIRAEAKFLGVGLEEGSSLTDIMKHLSGLLEAEMASQAEKMMHGGGFNMMGAILKAHQMGGGDLSGIDLSKYGVAKAPPVPKKDVDPEWFLKGDKSKRMFDDPKWHEIAKAFVAVEQANTDKEIVRSIDFLNQLQHNSFHILIDLQTGRMLTKYEGAVDHDQARKNLQEILDAKLKSTSVHGFISKMGKEIRDLVLKYDPSTIFNRSDSNKAR